MRQRAAEKLVSLLFRRIARLKDGPVSCTLLHPRPRIGRVGMGWGRWTGAEDGTRTGTFFLFFREDCDAKIRMTVSIVPQ